MQIGSFFPTASGLSGHISTLTIERGVHLVPVTAKDNDDAPDWRLYLDDDAHLDSPGAKAGAGWTQPSQRGGDEHALLWSTPRRRTKEE